MALKSCRECGRPVGGGSDACPNCGATAPWSRKNPRRGNDALWVMGTLILGVMLLVFLNGCGSTSPNDQTPQIGRYDYQIHAAGLEAGGDLVISAVNGNQASYRFFMPGVPVIGTAMTTFAPGTGWIFAGVPKLGWVASNTMVRVGDSYTCSTNLIGPQGPTTATCSFTFEGPDSVRVSP